MGRFICINDPLGGRREQGGREILSGDISSYRELLKLTR
jgi:hypothetical protein